MQTRGHLIFNVDGVWHKLYLAYNATVEYMLPVLDNSEEFLKRLLWCKTGVADIEKHDHGVTAREYHDYRNFDHLKHPNQEFTTLEEAFKSCTLTNVFIHRDGKWEHKTVQEINPDFKPEVRKRTNVWRERRLAKEAKKANGES